MATESAIRQALSQIARILAKPGGRFLEAATKVGGHLAGNFVIHNSLSIFMLNHISKVDGQLAHTQEPPKNCPLQRDEVRRSDGKGSRGERRPVSAGSRSSENSTLRHQRLRD